MSRAPVLVQDERPTARSRVRHEIHPLGVVGDNSTSRAGLAHPDQDCLLASSPSAVLLRRSVVQCEMARGRYMQRADIGGSGSSKQDDLFTLLCSVDRDRGG
jgi:hypothetical protein